MTATPEMTKILGLHTRAARTPVDFIACLEAGLPLEAVTRVAREIAPTDSQFVFRLVSRPTLARRRAGPAAKKRLSPDEGARVARLASVWTLAQAVWGGDEAARAFLERPHPLLDGQTPLDIVLMSEFGGPLVEGILQSLRYGSAA